MFNVSFAADYEGIVFGEEELIRIVSHIAMKAEENFGSGIIFKDLFVIDSDMDRIFISTDPDATKDSDADYIIRTWDYSCKSHLKGDLISEYISINWTFHIMEDCEDMEGRCSHDHCDGTDEIPLDDVNGFYSSSFDSVHK